MRQIIVVVVLAVLATACTSSGDTATDYIAELRPAAVETNVALGDVVGTLITRFDTRGQLYQKLGDLRLPSAVAIALDKVKRVEPTEEYVAAHERYVEFVTELLDIAEEFDGAVASQELDALVGAYVRFRSAESAVALALPPGMCQTIAPAGSRDLCALEVALDGYDLDLDIALRRFTAAYRPAVDLPAAFGNAARSRMAVVLTPQVLDVIARSRAEVADLTPDVSTTTVHEIVLEYFDALDGLWRPLLEASTFSDPLLIAVLDSALLKTKCEAIAAVSTELTAAGTANRAAEALDIVFTAEPGACEE